MIKFFNKKIKRLLNFNKFYLNAMKDGKLHILRLVSINVLGLDIDRKYRLVIYYPDGRRAIAEYQPESGTFPDIQKLTEKNGFKVVDISDLAKKNIK
ncbi:MAG: hypothetical protein FWE72_08290 [Spirochaetaceae bacterium]|nr:hypothetical protein [Spirochaetaceae bacterium]